jgi:UDP-3-O-[3-hydroxymyristoyl] N-acetylglucosamine deacetylase/3-hydroxyacyl-[acyl-carrier-protein] dehydratase
MPPVSVTRGNSSIIALPCDELKISCTSADDRGIHTQHLSLTIDPDAYMTQIAAARTFTIYEDIEELLKLGKIKGGSLDCAVVIKGDKIISKEACASRTSSSVTRFSISSATSAARPAAQGAHHRHPARSRDQRRAHQGALGEKLEDGRKARRKSRADRWCCRRDLPRYPAHPRHAAAPLSVRDDRPRARVHRRRRARRDQEREINEPYFQGHFPGNPVMPGVLQLEAMAQAAGILMLRAVPAEGKTALFMSADKVKFRKPVRPGDQLVINAKLTKSARRQARRAEATCTVGGQVVSSAELMFAMVDSRRTERMAAKHPPTAIVEPAPSSGPTSTSAPTPLSGPDVTLGAGTRLHHHASVEGNTVLGAQCEVFPMPASAARRRT